jgi:hypothetical protein
MENAELLRSKLARRSIQTLGAKMLVRNDVPSDDHYVEGIDTIGFYANLITQLDPQPPCLACTVVHSY